MVKFALKKACKFKKVKFFTADIFILESLYWDP